MENPMALQGIQQILRKLCDTELFGLAGTVTQGLLRNKLTTLEGAIEVIIKYSPDFHSILKRKAITKDVLFSYLLECNITVTMPATKNTLIDAISTYWNLEQPVSYNSFDNSSNQEISRPTVDIPALALKFTEWFYTMMNQNTPLGPEHFWQDAKLQLTVIFATQNITETAYEDVTEIVRLLYKTKCKYSLYFNPNFSSEGVQGRIDPHGLVAVLVCGTLHSNDACVGVFEQVFMLARDPFAHNNWKIKSTELNLRSKSDVSALPSLCDSSLTCNLLALPPS